MRSDLNEPSSASVSAASSSLSMLSTEFPAWCKDDKIPVSLEKLSAIFDDLTNKFGFQKSNRDNMFHHLLAQLDSRASRTTANMALVSLHSSYIGGNNANYKKWFFACQLDLDEEIGFNNITLHGKSNQRNKALAKKRGVNIKEQMEILEQKEQEFLNNNHTQIFIPDISRTNGNSIFNNVSNNSLANNKNGNGIDTITNDVFELDEENCKKNKKKRKKGKYGKLKYQNLDYKWTLRMKQLTSEEMARQLALYLLCWGEANQVRFTPECLCFIFKCALDYDFHNLSPDENKKLMDNPMEEFDYLDNVITPIYNFLRDQVYEKVGDKYNKRERDHKDIIGYDDANQLFWYPEGIERIVLHNGDRLVDKPLHERYLYLRDVNWSKVFYKTYREKRTWLHCATNFNRIWIIHFSTFWFFTSFNTPTLYTKNYIQLLNNPPTPQARFSVVAFSGTIACMVQIFATMAEWTFVPREWPGAQHLLKRMLGLLFCFLINFVPSIYTLGMFDLDVHSQSAYIISIGQLVIAMITIVFFSIRPLGGLFTSYLNKGKTRRRYISSQTFTASFARLTGRSKWFSHGLWVSVFFCKFIESYFFLTLSLRDPIRVLSILDMSRCKGDKYLNTLLCKLQPKITLFIMLIADLVLFFLDTYLWYIVCNCVFSIILSISLGTSILTPWKNIYSRLPKRIYSKILATSEMDVQYKPKLLISQVWNAVVISMYREHLLSIDHVRRLLYQQVDSVMPGKKTLKSPTFFVAEDDSTFKSTEYFQENSEAQRRVSFFAQSLSTPITEPIPVECMPSFTVLIPHYSEKIVLSLREIIKEENANTKITLLEYLKQLYPHEWECFVRDTKLLAFESGYISSDKAKRGNLDQEEKEDDSHANNSPNLTNNDNDYDFIQNRINDLPFYSVGFNSSNAEFTLRTRIWASLRTQTLYRTISGFMNYAKAIKLLYRIENPSMVQVYGEDQEGLDLELEGMANRKFKMVVSMQRLEKFTPNELEATNFLLRAYPHLRIAYLEENKQDSHIYSCLIDGFCDIDAETGKRIPMYRVRLSGNPILGDGKSDNQNHAIIFYRGEYIQVIDANQDNYLEECLKIRSVLSEFEELEMDNTLPYIPGVEYHYDKAPVAIVGAREYIFSENIGVLGDIAAGKEQTFGTLFARTLAEIGAKLHYGHPDFINAIFMTTRGGLSKSQKGLHLNEDIYAGMTAICRGGRIKHSDYYQCGKGRDLGFCQILNFTTKIGAGMGEQLLSREYYYIGTQMPIDRFLSFFYAHPGFHLNNLFITMSVQLFFLLLLNIGSMNHELIKCVYNKDIPITDVEKPIGCYNLEPVLHWVTIFVLSIFIVFFISFAPLLIQELLERGIWKSISRFFHHILSMAPFFEVFVCQIYSNSLMSDVTFGGARYISTGRGFAVTRIEFYQLYTRFSTTSIYSGCKLFLMLLFSMVSMWQPALLWFCITLISMCLAPFIFNPHQFSFVDFFVDYRELLRWFSHGYGAYSPNSWTSYTKVSRARYTGFKKKMISDESEKNLPDIKKPYFKNLFVAEFLKPVFTFIFSFTAYTFINAQTGVRMVQPTNSVLRLVIVGLMPILVNQIVLAFLFAVALFTGPTTSCFCNKTGDLMAGISHTVSVFIYLLDFQVIWFLEGWDFTRTLLLLIVIINLHDVIFKFITIFMLTREFKNNKSSIAWWSGNWYRTGMGWATITQPMREYTIQIMESSYFTADFLCSHLLLSLQVPFVFIPFFDRCHSMILFWLKPNILNTQKFIYTKKQLIRRKKIVRRYIFIYFVILTSLLTFLVLPIFTAKYIPDISGTLSKTTFEGLIQPKMQHNNDTGENAPKTFLLKAPEPGPIIKTVR